LLESPKGNAEDNQQLRLIEVFGNFLKEFSSAKEAGDYLGNPRANSEIIKVCKGYISPKGKRYLTSLGYRWKYKQSSTTIP
jgi:hypothetical protein